MTIGTWLDERECLSLVGRGWYGGRKTYHYDQNQDQTSILVRPFLNVSDDQTPAQDTQIIAFPNRATGTVHVEAMSEVFGADVSLRRFLYGDLGVTFDFLYGYQFMRVNENLGIASNSTSLNEDFAPIGSMLSVADTFSVSNEFHGGQVGLASNYRERCWSFNALAKVGFGSLRRQATRTGLTVTTVDDVSATGQQRPACTEYQFGNGDGSHLRLGSRIGFLARLAAIRRLGPDVWLPHHRDDRCVAVAGRD